MSNYKFLKSSQVDYELGIGLNSFQNYRRVGIFGNNPSIASGVNVADIWTGAGLYPWMTAATSLEIVSDNTNDTSAGTGARAIIISGLDINYAEISNTVTLNGTTAVAIPQQYFRINAVVISSAGSNQVNIGTLTVRDVGGGTTRAIIQAGYGQTRQACFTVPAGHTLSLTAEFFCINRPSSTRDCTLTTWARSPTGVYRQPAEISVSSNPVVLSTSNLGILPEKTDISVRVLYASAANTDVTAALIGLLIKNTEL